MLSCHEAGPAIIMNGEHKGLTLSQVISLWGEEAIGKKAAAYNDFQLLIKLIDAKQKLSVQVHRMMNMP